mmetsp:Transcript_8999/g.22608  ORF Transcript_8999/g.22608 Transcript_8999/m.22608 type:complete len:311 (+) Transcript_8999:350-1282(+)
MKGLLNNLGFGAPCEVDLEFEGATGAPLRHATIKDRSGSSKELPLYSGGDGICGKVTVRPTSAKKVEHAGMKVQLLGQIELASDRHRPQDFVALVRELSAPGELYQTETMNFEFSNVEMQYDAYYGSQVKLRYLLRVTVARNAGGYVVKDFPFWVRNSSLPEDADKTDPIKMEVGIEDCLHIEFEYGKGVYSLLDTVVGKIYFLLVRIKLKHMEIEIRRRETTGTGANLHNESETLAKYEIMDGAPVRGENVPIRLFLAPYELTPTYKNVNNKFSVRYFLNLVLVDEEERRYFKQQEIHLFRKAEDGLEK